MDQATSLECLPLTEGLSSSALVRKLIMKKALFVWQWWRKGSVHKFIWLLQKLFFLVDEQYQQLSVYYTHKFLLNNKSRKKVVLEKITS